MAFRAGQTVRQSILAAAIITFPCTGVCGDKDHGRRIDLPPAFPAGAYTPHGYLDNPFHSMVFNRSGIVRSLPDPGFAWWRMEFPGSYGGGARDHVNYLSGLQIGVLLDGTPFCSAEDFRRAGVELTSRYHTKHLMSYDWTHGSVAVSLKFFLPREHTIGCLVELENRGAARAGVTLHATHLYWLGETRWWGSDGLTSRYRSTDRVSVAKCWAYGDAMVLGSTLAPAAHRSTGSEDEWLRSVRSEDTTSSGIVFVKGRGPLRTVQTFRLALDPGAQHTTLVWLSRGVNEEAALREWEIARDSALSSLRQQLAEDQRFWSSCPTLDGDWPSGWKQGWVYDFETLRMTVRRPTGIFRHPWDAMQIHSPRVVLGETSLDMMTLSYADPALAKEVLFGTFADALAPNVPCSREDGSVNMISSDGSECGTAPMWGYPFHMIRAIYHATGDNDWITRLYPYLKAYIEWWLENRTDREGWLHCNNSWESGQDGSKRFLVAEGNEAAVADFVRTVDVEASMAEAMAIMEEFAPIAGRPGDRAVWQERGAVRVRNTRDMFVDGWFRDVDGRTGKPIILPGTMDVMMLAPVACAVATPEQVRAVRPKFRYFLEHPRGALEWPPLFFTFTEAAWAAEERLTAAEAVSRTADRVYARTDARSISRRAGGQELHYRVPGVANEFWPEREVPPGGENYGWGATLPMLFLRNLLGFREGPAAKTPEFTIAPTLPARLLTPGKMYRVRNLQFRGDVFDVTISPESPDRLTVELVRHVEGSGRWKILDGRRRELYPAVLPGMACKVRGKNGDLYRIGGE